MRRLMMILPLILLSACTSYVWVKPTGDPSTFAADSYSCKKEAMDAAPPVYQTTQVVPRMFAGPDIVRSRCEQDGPIQTCRTRYYTHDDYYAPPTTYDLNENARGDLYGSCMNARGWVLQAVENK